MTRKTRETKANLSDLIEAKVITPGIGVIAARGKESEITADLTPKGKIVFNGQTYSSLTAFTTAAFQRYITRAWHYTMYRAEGSSSWHSLEDVRENCPDDVFPNQTRAWPLREVKMIVVQLSAIGAPANDASIEAEQVVTGAQNKDDGAVSTKAEATEEDAPTSVATDKRAKDDVIPCPAFSLTLVDWVSRSRVSLETKTVEDVKVMVDSIVAAAEDAFSNKKQQKQSATGGQQQLGGAAQASSSISISAGEYTIRLAFSVLRKLGRRLKLIEYFRQKVLTKTKSEIETSIRLVPLNVSKFTPSWWSSQNDVELLLGGFLLSLYATCLSLAHLLTRLYFLRSFGVDVTGCAVHGIDAWGMLSLSKEVAALSTRSIAATEGSDPAAIITSVPTGSQTKASLHKFLLSRFSQLVNPHLAEAMPSRRMKASLVDLIKAKMIVPGAGVISVRGKQSEITADLTPEGIIIFNGRKFNSPSGFVNTILKRQHCNGWPDILYRAEGSSSWFGLVDAREHVTQNLQGSELSRPATKPWPLKEVKLILAQLSKVGVPGSDASIEAKQVVTTSQEKEQLAAKLTEATTSVAADKDAKDNVISCPAFSLTLVDWVSRSKVSLETKTVQDVKVMVDSIVTAAEDAFSNKKQRKQSVTGEQQQSVGAAQASSSISISAGQHKIRLALSVLRKLGRRLALIEQFRLKVVTQTQRQIENLVRSIPLRATKFTPSWWSSQNDTELLLGQFLC